jgi:hypothetical protein
MSKRTKNKLAAEYLHAAAPDTGPDPPEAEPAAIERLHQVEGQDEVDSQAELRKINANLLAACQEAKIFAAVIASGAPRHGRGEQKELGVKWRSTEEYAKGIADALDAAIARAKGGAS